MGTNSATLHKEIAVLFKLLKLPYGLWLLLTIALIPGFLGSKTGTTMKSHPAGREGGVASHKGILQRLQCYSIPGSCIILGEGDGPEEMMETSLTMAPNGVNPENRCGYGFTSPNLGGSR